ncbi:phytoene/squalene synthase family protein [Demequina flava]|uniref:phytoene/squalene synthase family protein n=1 Tax=Demequina flava TaxID=1095025 RepID=UPI0009E3AB66|nr:squalene/phytoene synthase family protein [Demequina flava]
MSQVSREVHHTNETSLALYDEACQAAAAQVIRKYSSSFGLGARLLTPAMRTHIASIYAMVRVADEIVDTYQGADAGEVLAGFEAQVARALDGKFCSDVIAHAFGVTAAAVGIGHDLVDPFFESMRMDLTETEHDQASFDRYVYGSAEVIGEMCLAVFLADGDGDGDGNGPASPPEDVRAGARALGSAYQKINFLRDLGADLASRGRVYFPGLSLDTLTDADIATLTQGCRADLTLAKATLPALPPRAHASVASTLAIYEELLDRIEATQASALTSTRVSVPRRVKVSITARTLAAVRKERA